MPPADPTLNLQVQTLYTEHHGWLQGWLGRKLGNACDAADLAHDTFVRLLSRQGNSYFGSEPRALLTHIAKGLVVDRWRRQDVERAYLEAIAHLPQPEVPSPETRWLILETLCRVDAMLRDMPARVRQVFLLSQLDGLTYAQIAEQLQLSLITIKRDMRTAFLACLSIDG
ncbi:TPA: sigma-70 family RNA polymerase sigma factor [Pseudomonas putida]|jgi:RNA polymerase sigma factor (sigma-70 family)|uniref:Sigma-70 family RNA polymerase sigma factor n=2 Tax=Pseudomonas putida TaxID=303 RepID=A0A166J8B4_PSEPU|nr:MULTISPECIES: sigma-70 family RNA polymerase sigma factor [Pseudomonas]ELF6206881.1 sigma-70 family RNA polymerase sigma factor [Pseudomonas putida]ELU0819546.1 sigma-70 family RNA polymerase sigma factor [Pseudomonas putida]KAF0251465.1 sigma-70 family RNA polymerase sigma factor [Pseudomonas putida]MBH3347156.1 sigma-70 family RNA polymerase sigma factor [Pseudomonas putida]MBH3388271.1 sigma-70 family RNA polymerase sigma factor [Pseudomonas putida]